MQPRSGLLVNSKALLIHFAARVARCALLISLVQVSSPNVPQEESLLTAKILVLMEGTKTSKHGFVLYVHAP